MSFPTPSDFSLVASLDLNQFVKNPPATFFLRVSGDDMIKDCIHSGDLLIVDRSLDPIHDCLVVAVVEGELWVRRLHRVEGQFKLKQLETDSYYSGDFEIWGVITTMIHSVFGGYPD